VCARGPEQNFLISASSFIKRAGHPPEAGPALSKESDEAVARMRAVYDKSPKLMVLPTNGPARVFSTARRGLNTTEKIGVR
jgi:hypothetical protein